MGKISQRKFKKAILNVATNNAEMGYVQGLEAAANLKSIAEVRTAAKQVREAWDAKASGLQKNYKQEVAQA